jgi:hypothetical protein
MTKENRFLPLREQFEEDEEEIVDASDQPQEGWEEDLSVIFSANSVLQPPFGSTTTNAINSKRLQPVRKNKSSLKVKSLTRGKLSTGLMLSEQEVAFLSRPSAPRSLQQAAIKLGFPTLSRPFGRGGGLSMSSKPTSAITCSSPVSSPFQSNKLRGMDSLILPSSDSTSTSSPIPASQPNDTPPIVSSGDEKVIFQSSASCMGDV